MKTRILLSTLFFLTSYFAHNLSIKEKEILDKFLFSQYDYKDEVVLEKHKYFTKLIDKTLPSMGFQSKKLAGSGSYGLVVIADTERKDFPEVALKVVEKQEDDCPDDSIIKRLNEQPDNLVIRFIDRFIAPVTVEQQTHQFCGMVLEAAEQSLKDPLFTEADDDTERNTKVLSSVLRQTISGFYHLNFHSHILHGDIKPANIVAVKSRRFGFEPRIIDFDLAFSPDEEEQETGVRASGNILYTLDFRPPEMRFFCEKNNCNDESKHKYPRLKNIEYYYLYFRFSKDYLEDSFALGVTLLDVLKINAKFINSEDEFLAFVLENVIRKMTATYTGRRINTFEAFKEIEGFINEHDLDFSIAKESEDEPRTRPKMNLERSEFAGKPKDVQESVEPESYQGSSEKLSSEPKIASPKQITPKIADFKNSQELTKNQDQPIKLAGLQSPRNPFFSPEQNSSPIDFRTSIKGETNEPKTIAEIPNFDIKLPMNKSLSPKVASEKTENKGKHRRGETAVILSNQMDKLAAKEQSASSKNKGAAMRPKETLFRPKFEYKPKPNFVGGLGTLESQIKIGNLINAQKDNENLFQRRFSVHPNPKSVPLLNKRTAIQVPLFSSSENVRTIAQPPIIRPLLSQFPMPSTFKPETNNQGYLKVHQPENLARAKNSANNKGSQAQIASGNEDKKEDAKKSNAKEFKRESKKNAGKINLFKRVI